MDNYFAKNLKHLNENNARDENRNISSKSAKKKNIHQKITEICLEDQTLTLWRPAAEAAQYRLIPEVVTADDWPAILRTYYAQFDCISSVLLFDEALPIISQQTTTLCPTHDYSILRDYPRIKGIWFQPEKKADILGTEDESPVGNVKLSISLPCPDRDLFLSEMNVYYLEVMDYESDDKSVSRFLLTKNNYPDLPLYDIYKPGGPLYAERLDTLDGEQERYHFLRVCNGYTGRVMEHVVELMMEEDPWPLCQISTATHKPLKPPVNLLDLPEDHVTDEVCHVNTRYLAATWEESLAGLFAWSMRNHLHWLVYERLHENTKTVVRLMTIQSPVEKLSSCTDVTICSKRVDLLVDLSRFIAKCVNEMDIQELHNLYTNLHTCGNDCHLVDVRHLDFACVIPPYLSLLERVIACRSVRLRRDVMNTMLPWAVLVHHFSDQNIDSCQKMVAFLSKLNGISQEFPDPDNNNFYFYNSLAQEYTEKTPGLSFISFFSDEDKTENASRDHVNGLEDVVVKNDS